MNAARLRALGARWYPISLLVWVVTWIVFAVLARHVGVPWQIAYFPLWGPPALWALYEATVRALGIAVGVLAIVLKQVLPR